MSYDIELNLPPCAHCGRGSTTVHEANITSNVSKIVELCLTAAGALRGKPSTDENGAYDYSWQRLHGWRGIDLVLILDRARQYLWENKPALKEFEPSNGWGSVEIVAEVLEGLHAACEKNPNGIIRVSW